MPRKVSQILVALSLIVACLLWAVPPSAQPNSGDAISTYLKNADQFYREGKYEYALAEYQKVLMLDPNHLYAQTQVTALKRQLGQEPTPPEGSDKATPAPSMVPGEGTWPVLPPRDYTKITTALDQPFVSAQHGFSMRPPAGWWVDQHAKKHVVKFTDPNYEAFLFVDVIPVKGNVEADGAFRKFVEQKTKGIEDSIGGFHPDYQNFTTFLGKTAFETRATFLAGPNTVRLHVLYVPAPGKVFQITSVCDDRLARFWTQIFDASLATFTITGP
jgi:hypothetical protein